MAQWITACAADLVETNEKTFGFGNIRNKMIVKINGSARGSRQDIVFSNIFLSLRRILIGLSWFICLPEGLLGPPPAGPENRPFRFKSVLARSHCRKADHIKISGMFERS